ncbi:hypothetical protein U5922_011725 [Aquicoccus sp. G2-2]|uniref:hypothetical protein n=1 Tax=Aquicoccus sp. G2-2 TaxID=3092120 RepID=UPI002ADFC55B|nr:hypothetical protein [Aquicoccus sp. G2-2]MEA1114093.1 hypothetical protein [Aquicoccus sp. G2-2]
MKELLELSWRTQVVFIGGYLAYVIAYSGRRHSHGTVDVFGSILCFGGIGLLGIGLVEACIGASQGEEKANSFLVYALGILGVGLPVITSLVWRGFLNSWITNAIHLMTKSKEDGLPTAWATVIQKQGLVYAQLVVTLKSGVSYESYPLGAYNSAPDGPCILGSDGSIAMFVTYITEADGNGRPAKNLVDGDGLRMTYIPSSEIAEVDLRRKTGRNS